MLARLALLLVLLFSSGCGYHVGSLRRPGIRRIAVPVFANQTLRRGFERDITRAVQREIKESSSYLLSSAADADAVLVGEIRGIQESVLVEGRVDQVLEGKVQVSLAIRLLDRSGRPLSIDRESVSGGADKNGWVALIDQAEYVLTRGEDRTSATREALKELAERVVQVATGPSY